MLLNLHNTGLELTSTVIFGVSWIFNMGPFILFLFLYSSFYFQRLMWYYNIWWNTPKTHSITSVYSTLKQRFSLYTCGCDLAYLMYIKSIFTYTTFSLKLLYRHSILHLWISFILFNIILYSIFNQDCPYNLQLIFIGSVLGHEKLFNVCKCSIYPAYPGVQCGRFDYIYKTFFYYMCITTTIPAYSYYIS